MIRKDQTNNLKLRQLQSAIDEGFKSGVSQKSILDIIDEINQHPSWNGNYKLSAKAEVDVSDIYKYRTWI